MSDVQTPPIDPLPESDTQTSAFVRALVENRLVRKPQIDRCLEIRDRLRSVGIEMNLGEVLCAQGCLASAELEVLSRLQANRREDGPGTDTEAPSEMPETDFGKIGAIVVANRLLTPAQVQECLNTQRAAASVGIQMKLGEVMSRKGHLSPEILDSVLAIQRAQRKRRRIVLSPPAATFLASLAVGALIAVAGSYGARETDLEPRASAPAVPESPSVTSYLAPGEEPDEVAIDSAGSSTLPDPTIMPPPSPPAESPTHVVSIDVEEAERRREIERRLFPPRAELPGERALFPDRFRTR